MKKYIPKQKGDFEAIEYLRTCPFDEVKADVPRLLEWMQDLHWEVGQGIGTYLAPHVNEIKKELIDILNTSDAIWKFNIIVALITKSLDKPDQELIAIIKRIANHPTKMEIEDDVDEAARNAISDKGW